MHSLLFYFSILTITISLARPDLKDTSSLQALNEDVRYGRKPIRGVNLGGWLIVEHSTTATSPVWEGVPDDIANKGEYSTIKYLGHERGDSQFDRHRSTFITEQDFKDIAAIGLNTVRIPVGYWITGFDNSGGGDPNGWKTYTPGAIDYLDKAIREWAPNNNILVLISMHAAKGSQNGRDSTSPIELDHAYWSSYKENVDNTLDVVEWLARRYNNDVAFLGIGLLNSPENQNETVLKQYYYDAYARIRAFSDCLLTTSPTFSERIAEAEGWKGFMSPPKWYGVRHECHRYQVWGFEPENGWNAEKIINYVNDELTNDILSWTGNWLYISEWSLGSKVSMDDDDTLRRYGQVQLKAFSHARGGWTYWTWKTYNDDGSSKNQWSMKSMIKRGILQLNPLEEGISSTSDPQLRSDKVVEKDMLFMSRRFFYHFSNHTMRITFLFMKMNGN